MERSIASLLRRTLHHHDLLVPAFFCTQVDAADEGLAFLHFHASSSILKSLDLVAICWQRRICLDCFALGLACTSSFSFSVSSSLCAAAAAEPRRLVLVQKSHDEEAPSQSQVEGHDRQRCRAVARSVIQLLQTLLDLARCPAQHQYGIAIILWGIRWQASIALPLVQMCVGRPHIVVWGGAPFATAPIS